MKASRSLGRLAVAVLSASTVSPAWAWSLARLDALLVRRADSTASSSTRAQQTTVTGSDNTFNLNTATVSSAGADPTETGTTPTGKTSGKTTVTGKATGTSTGTKTKATSHKTYDMQDPAGSVVMITPAATAAMQLYKIGDFVTWGWNYTNLQATPTAIDLLASCSFASRTFTLTQNMTFQTHGSYTWDTGAFQSDNVASPLLTEEYTLILYDAESSVSATAEAGYLGTFEGFTFGLYATQSYTPLADGWTCATCSGAMSDMEKRAVGFALTMSIITVLSFTWFVTGMRLTL